MVDVCEMWADEDGIVIAEGEDVRITVVWLYCVVHSEVSKMF